MVHKMSMATILLCSVISSTMILHLVTATDYTVGSPTGGWDSITNLQTWASSQPFSVGDNLIFQYAPNHNVIEVTKTDYDSCQATNAIQTYTDGATTVSLAIPGKRYFICGTPGHCIQGMKVEVNTLATTTSFAPSPSPVATPLTDESPISSPTLSPLSPFAPSPSLLTTPLTDESPINSPTLSPFAPSPSPSLETTPLTDESSISSPTLSPLMNSPTYGPTLSPLSQFAQPRVSGLAVESPPFSSSAVAREFSTVLGVVMIMVLVL